jgi:uncharacterized membrane-anchored protein YhcB (DUF1043 family)
MLGNIPFKVPAHFETELLSGSVVRVGALLKDSGTGKIVAHLQETGLAQKLLGSIPSSIFAPVNALSSVTSNLQLVQLKNMVEGLKLLQYANLGVAVSGIGVSALGFALMNKKLKVLQTGMSALQQSIDAHFKHLHQRELRSHFSRISGLFEQAAQAFHQSVPSLKWQKLEADLADESAYFKGEIAFVVDSEFFDRDLFESLVRAFALCNAGRIECLTNAGELPAAQRVARDTSGHYNELFDPLSPTLLAHRSLAALDDKASNGAANRQRELKRMKELIENVRDIQDAAACKPLLFQTLIDRNVDGRQYMQLIREESDRPLLLLPAI